MSNLHDKFDRELANKFRKELEEYEVEFNPKDWDKIRPALEVQNDKVRVLGYTQWLRRVAAGVAVVFTLGASAWFVQKNYQNFVAQQQKTSSQAEKISFDTPSNTVLSMQDSQEEYLANTKKQAVEPKEDISSASSTPKVLNHSFSKKENTFLRTSKTTSKGLSSSVVLTLEIEKEEQALASTHTSEEEFSKEALAILQLDANIEEPSLNEENPILQTSASFETKTAHSKLFSFDKIGFSFAPSANVNIYDYNTYKSYFTRELGVSVDFKTCYRFSINTGVFVSDYKSRKVSVVEFANNDVVSLSQRTFEADLIYLNFPINVRYTLGKNEAKTKSFISAGVSNFTYIREKFDDTYERTTLNRGNDKPDYVQEQNTELYDGRYLRSYDMVSSVNFSVGIERALGKNSSIEIEPFARLSLKELAAENVEFNTFGLRLRASYGIKH